MSERLRHQGNGGNVPASPVLEMVLDAAKIRAVAD
jgi:hypothetical protein